MNVDNAPNSLTLDISPYDPIIVDVYLYNPARKRSIPVSLLFDTGADGLCLSKSFVNEHQFVAIGEKHLDTANNRIAVKSYSVPGLCVMTHDFGDATATECSIHGLDDLEQHGLVEPQSPGFAGMMGMDYIRGFDISINFTNKQIVFMPRLGYIEGIRARKHDMSKAANDLVHLAMRGQITLPVIQKDINSSSVTELSKFKKLK